MDGTIVDRQGHIPNSCTHATKNRDIQKGKTLFVAIVYVPPRKIIVIARCSMRSVFTVNKLETCQRQKMDDNSWQSSTVIAIYVGYRADWW